MAEGDKIGRRYFTTSGIAATKEPLIWSAFFPNGGRGASRDERAERADHREPRHRSRDRVEISPSSPALLHEATRMLTHSQGPRKVAVLKKPPSFVVMRGLAMRFRGFYGRDPTSSALAR